MDRASDAARASIAVTASGTEVAGEISRVGSRYVVRVGDDLVGDPSGLDIAILRLTTALRTHLPPVAPPHWEVRARCHTVVFSVQLTDEGPQIETASDVDCLRRVLADHPCHTLSEAIETAARVLAGCCR